MRHKKVSGLSQYIPVLTQYFEGTSVSSLRVLLSVVPFTYVHVRMLQVPSEVTLHFEASAHILCVCCPANSLPDLPVRQNHSIRVYGAPAEVKDYELRKTCSTNTPLHATLTVL